MNNWTAKLHDGEQEKYSPHVSISDSDGCYIAQVKLTSVGYSGSLEDRKRTEGNAYLILAAPELFTALDQLVKYHTDENWRNEQESRADEVTDHNVSFLEVLVERAKDAIEKAQAFQYVEN